MISYDKQSGSIDILNNDDSYMVILDTFIGSITVESDCKYLTFVLYDNSIIINDIELYSDDKLDTITIQGKGYCEFQSISATSIEIYTNIKAKHIIGNVVKIKECKVEGTLQETIIEEIADKSQLIDLLNQLNALIDTINSYSISYDGKDVLIEDMWVTPSAKSVFDECYTIANSVKSDKHASQEAVDDAVNNLYSAYNNLDPQRGLKRETNKAELEDILTATNLLLQSVDTSDDGYDVPQTSYWIRTSNYIYLNDKYLEALSVFNDTSVTQETVNLTTSKLKYYYESTHKHSGKQTDYEIASKELKDELNYRIEIARQLLSTLESDNGMIISTDGEDSIYPDVWCTQYSYNNLTEILNTCEELYDNPNAAKSSVEHMLDRYQYDNEIYIIYDTDAQVEDMSHFNIEIENGILEIGIYNNLPDYQVNEILGCISIAVKGLNIEFGSKDNYIPIVRLTLSEKSNKHKSTNKTNILLQTNLRSGLSVFIDVKGHIWIIDSILDDIEHDISIQSPYILIDNSKITIESNVHALYDINNGTPVVSIENCYDVSQSDTSFSCFHIVGDEYPKSFIYKVIKDENGKVKQLLSREKLYANNPAQLATNYDIFKHSTQYTNVDLHRYIDQNSKTVYQGYGDNYISFDDIIAICKKIWSGESVDWEAIPNEIIEEICKLIYEYDGHPHTSEPISNDIIESIINGTYAVKYNGYNLSELTNRQYELLISSLNSYRSTTMPVYVDNSEDEEIQKIIDSRELP